ncbi:MAG: hypothetical protein JWN73_2503 [Betaproteobacteria bacterium]|nr:hypothetical protein [Betaproteobacteria bacterium]
MRILVSLSRHAGTILLLTMLWATPAASQELPCSLALVEQSKSGYGYVESEYACVAAADIDPWAAILRKIGNRERLGANWVRGNSFWEQAYQELEKADPQDSKKRIVGLAREFVKAGPAPLIWAHVTAENKELVEKTPRLPAFTFLRSAMDHGIAMTMGLAYTSLIDPYSAAGKQFYGHFAELQTVLQTKLLMTAEKAQVMSMTAEQKAATGPAIAVLSTAFQQSQQALQRSSGGMEALYLPVYSAAEAKILEIVRTFKATQSLEK